MDSKLTSIAQAFENTSTNVAAAQMRNALTNLAETVEDPEQKKVSNCDIQRQEMQTLIIPAAVRDRNGQLLCPLPPLPQRQG
jgi:UTP--glucose-1-phosphate uridylyltransferase